MTHLCECGCGQPTVISPCTDRWHGWAKGEPRRFIAGHNGRLNRAGHISEDRGYMTPCWIWTGSLNAKGYGRCFGGMAHRRYYEEYIGPVPEGRTIDHLCRVREGRTSAGSPCRHSARLGRARSRGGQRGGTRVNGPVEIQITRHHAYKKRPSGRGCEVCGAAKTAVEHLGSSDSLNVLGSGNQFAYQNLKKAWAEALTLALEQSGLPRGECTRIVVEGEMCFPDRRRRDQGNHRFIVEKALGDALVASGWLPDDDWSRYEFGGLSMVYAKGESWTRLVLFPTGGVHVLGRAAA
jgi:hypothetical protein